MPDPLNTHVWDTSCLYTVLKNVSGTPQICSFLPPHGVTLANNETIAILGDPVEAIANGDRVGKTRAIQAYLDMLARRDLVIISTPTPILKDATSGASKMLTLDNGTLGSADPCWTTSVS